MYPEQRFKIRTAKENEIYLYTYIIYIHICIYVIDNVPGNVAGDKIPRTDLTSPATRVLLMKGVHATLRGGQPEDRLAKLQVNMRNAR